MELRIDSDQDYEETGLESTASTPSLTPSSSSNVSGLKKLRFKARRFVHTSVNKRAEDEEFKEAYTSYKEFTESIRRLQSDLGKLTETIQDWSLSDSKVMEHVIGLFSVKEQYARIQSKAMRVHLQIAECTQRLLEEQEENSLVTRETLDGLESVRDKVLERDGLWLKLQSSRKRADNIRDSRDLRESKEFERLERKVFSKSSQFAVLNSELLQMFEETEHLKAFMIKESLAKTMESRFKFHQGLASAYQELWEELCQEDEGKRSEYYREDENGNILFDRFLSFPEYHELFQPVLENVQDVVVEEVLQQEKEQDLVQDWGQRIRSQRTAIRPN